MKQFPSRLKYKKNHKAKFSNFLLLDQKNFFPLKGQFFLKLLEPGKLTFKHIEACRKCIRRNLKKAGTINIRLFMSFSKTKKAIGSRMGKGKGSHSIWICVVRAGQIICEVNFIPNTILDYKVLLALRGAGSKIPLKTTICRLIY